jgi:hypothetical protein
VRVTQCPECAYYGPALETHILFAVLQDDGDHARELSAELLPNERSVLLDQVDALREVVRD